ncbi:GGDEF domain-containing protein [Persephonella sp. IF05-L8]|uniref:diguanylate cyclase n=1 Tax=Persephonella sp. IF05-L8 TaxID=1158338 RepID=UPI000495D364
MFNLKKNKEEKTFPDAISPEFDKIRLMYIFIIIGSIVLYIMSFVHLQRGEKDIFLFEALISTGGLLSLLYMRITKKVNVAENLILIGLYILFIVIIIDGGLEKTGIYWIFVFPFVSFFLKGNRVGLLWNIMVLGTILMLLYLSQKNIISIAYSPIEIRQFIGAYLIIMILAYIYENTLIKSYDKLSNLAMTDTLTGLYNRYYLFKKLKEEIEKAKKYGRPLCVIIFDIDNFKQINDKYGHDVGDAVLSMVARVVKKNIRDTDIVGRLGGEEFVIICPETDIQNGYIIADKIRKSISQINFGDFQVTVSMGLACFSGETAEQLLKKADIALYKAKNGGKDKVEIYTEKNYPQRGQIKKTTHQEQQAV